MLHAIEEFTVSCGSTLQLTTQHETLTLLRDLHQWQLFVKARLTPACTLHGDFEAETGVPLPEEWDKSIRWISGEADNAVKIVPCMADRSLVVKPEQSLLIPTHCRPKLYLSLPLMFQMYIGHSKKPFYEFFAEPMPQSWFGPSTRRGELSYQIETPVLLTEQELPALRNRVHMELRLQNRDSENLLIERLNLPVMFLPVYRVDHNQYWTSPLSITNDKLTDELNLHYGKGVPCKYQHLELVSDARLRSDTRTFMRALEAIIG